MKWENTQQSKISDQNGIKKKKPTWSIQTFVDYSKVNVIASWKVNMTDGIPSIWLRYSINLVMWNLVGSCSNDNNQFPVNGGSTSSSW